MEYEYNRSKSGPQVPMYRAPPSIYPKIGPHPHSTAPRPPPFQPNNPNPSPSIGLGIKVAIKPEYKIAPPPHLLPHVGDIPRSNFQFDFGLERKILAEAEKENPNWTKFGVENLPTKASDTSSSSKVTTSDPIVNKYIAMGLSREVVPIAVKNYGDNPTKVQEFVKGYTLLHEMGFSSNSVDEALVMYDNDTDKALAYFLNGSS